MPTRRTFLSAVAALPLVTGDSNGWIDLFDGHSLEGWRPSENKASWQVVDGMLAANGPRSHLFYDGKVKEANFKNFELRVELTTRPQCNSGIYFHTAYQETGFPEKGFEVQINNTATGDGDYRERKKTGSLYGLRNMYKQLVPDNHPFEMRIAVRGKNVRIYCNGELLVDYVEPTPPVIPAGGEKQRYLDHGTFALQCHNDGSKAFYRKVQVRPLPDDLPAYTGPPPLVDETYREVIDIGRHNVPMVDYQVYLHAGLTLEDALRHSRANGIQLGICANSTDLKSQNVAESWLRALAGKPVFFALYANDEVWTRRLSRETVQKFDYVIADRISDEYPVDLIRLKAADESAKLIDSLVLHKVAVELNSLDRTPSKAFIQSAKAAGCKFAMGTANTNAQDLKSCEYGLQMIEACQLDWHHFFVPGSWWPKAVDRTWPGA